MDVMALFFPFLQCGDTACPRACFDDYFDVMAIVPFIVEQAI
jgi:hypothetical protein